MRELRLQLRKLEDQEDKVEVELQRTRLVVVVGPLSTKYLEMSDQAAG